MINRRKFLHLAGAGAAGILTGGLDSMISVSSVGAAVTGNKKFDPALALGMMRNYYVRS